MMTDQSSSWLSERCLAATDSSPRSFNVIFMATLLAQLLSCYLAFMTFSSVNSAAVVGSINLIFVATLNYVIILQFCAISFGLEKLLDRGTASLKRQVDLNRHAALLEICRQTNTTYRRQILLTLIQVFGYLVTYSYYLIVGLILEAQVTSLEYILFLCMNIIVRFSILMLIAYSSERLKIAAAAFNDELFQRMCSDVELCRDKKLRLYVKMNLTVNFTACGFFDLGYPLVTSIISAATTYLVILVQFSIES